MQPLVYPHLDHQEDASTIKGASLEAARIFSNQRLTRDRTATVQRAVAGFGCGSVEAAIAGRANGSPHVVMGVENDVAVSDLSRVDRREISWVFLLKLYELSRSIDTLACG